MSAAFVIRISDDSIRQIEAWGRAPEELFTRLNSALQRILVMVENFIKVDYLSGQYSPSPRGGELPLGLRTGNLRQAVTHEMTEQLAGYVGTSEGPVNAYARAMLGPDDTVIRPVNAKHLWIPIADNLGPSGQARMSPREAMARQLPGGGRALSIFKSKAGNLVALLRDDKGGNYSRGAKKGLTRGKLLFVLKDEVTIHGTDALAKGFNEKSDEMNRILNDELSQLAAA